MAKVEKEGFETAFRCFQLKVVAAFAGVEAPSDDGSSLLFKGSAASLFSLNAAIRGLASQKRNSTFYPPSQASTNITRSMIDSWLDYALDLETTVNDWCHPIWGFLPKTESKFFLAPAKTEAKLKGLEEALVEGTFLVGNSVTLADVVIALRLLPAFLTVLDEKFWAMFPNCLRWLITVYQQPEFQNAYPKPPTVLQKAFAFSKSGDPWGKGAHPLTPLLDSLPKVSSSLEWPGDKVRDTFIEFFKAKQHDFVPSGPVVPVNDPTLLFTNAGMNQYKSIFLGVADPNSAMGKLKRACNSQKCIRAGGKHNDLDDVGKDNYHHTFFEMLGNWSFGDYFKKEAIAWAVELLVEVFGLESDRLYATYFGGDEKLGLPADEEAKQIWLNYFPLERVLPFGCKDNFWEMGDQGPCGPCTEIHYDRIGGRNVADLVNMDDPNVLEIWNVVFIQYNREEDGSLKTLPAQHVDTGMGMERVTSILQNKMSNYATDIFGPIFDEIERISGARPYTDKDSEEDTDGVDMAYRVVADHIRTLCFSIADGARPGSDGRDYVLRRILRRAVRFGRERLGAKEGFFASLVDVVVKNFGGFYPGLAAARDQIYEVIREEEASFSRTLIKGIERFKKAAAGAKNGVLEGYDAFVLWDSYGFPADLTQIMAEEAGLQVDMPGYDRALLEQKERSRAANKKTAGKGLKFEAEATAWLSKNGINRTNDAFKYEEGDVGTVVAAILTADGFVESVDESTTGAVGIVLESTSFYAESGGQVGDTGVLQAGKGDFSVADCTVAAGFVLHVGEAGVSLKVGEKITAKVDYGRRRKIVPNHTFTHILNHGLRKVLGLHASQKGSIVLPDRLRFDFSNPGVVDAEKLGQVEAICREHIEKALPLYEREVPLEEAKKINCLRAVFGEAYPDPVRVISIGRPVEELLAAPKEESNEEFSVEFCGGTHLKNTKEAGAFALISEEGIAKGVRRIIAMTGEEAEGAIEEGDRLSAVMDSAESQSGVNLEKSVNLLKQELESAVIPAAVKASLKTRLGVVTKKLLEMQKAVAADNKKKAIELACGGADEAHNKNLPYAVLRVDVGLDSKALNDAAAGILSKYPEMCVMLWSVDESKGKALALGNVPKSKSATLKAGDWVKDALAVVGGKGGGKPTVAQGQGPDFAKVPQAMEAAVAFAAGKL
ncbi:hypothetical protein BSKO_00526 [Bryopsis sp. KO-2023]|nr:hypothetical protein BSKO_00526 [Bryopsis sp. KO-2023]